jgi:hypothetical protein
VRLEIRLGHSQSRADPPSVPEQNFARVCQADRLRAATPIDQALANHAFERRNLLADRRLGVAEPSGSAIERAFLGNRLEREEMAELDSNPGHGANHCVTNRYIGPARIVFREFVP